MGQNGNTIAARLTACLAMLAGLCQCSQPPRSRHVPEQVAVERGKELILNTGCGACHEIPGVDWPRGRLGPSLVGYDDVGLIAGTLPNRAGTLAAFIRDPRSVKPDSPMPAMPLTPAEAADIAAYLYGADL